MNSSEIEKAVKKLALDFSDSLGVNIVDIHFEKEANEWYLRVYIDKQGGVSIDDCVNVSENLSRVLDERDPIPYSYMLEVSSSGEMPIRRFDDFERFIGRNVFISTYAALNGRKNFEGRVLGTADSQVSIDDGGEEITIPSKQIAKARLSVPVEF